MNIEPKEMQEIKSDFEEVHEALETISTIWEAGEEGQRNRIAFLRALADLARGNAAARSIAEREIMVLVMVWLWLHRIVTVTVLWTVLRTIHGHSNGQQEGPGR